MKKIVPVIVCAIICIIFSSCNINDIENYMDDTIDVENQTEKNPNDHQIPTIIPFDSIDELQSFISAAKGSSSQYNDFANKHNMKGIITQETAQNVASMISSTPIPSTKNSKDIAVLGGTYYVERKELNLYYDVNGVRYCFTYEYDRTSNYEYEYELALDNIAFASLTIDIYNAGGCFIGSTIIGTTVLSVRIYTEHKESVSFDGFGLVMASDIP